MPRCDRWASRIRALDRTYHATTVTKAWYWWRWGHLAW